MCTWRNTKKKINKMYFYLFNVIKDGWIHLFYGEFVFICYIVLFSCQISVYFMKGEKKQYVSLRIYLEILIFYWNRNHIYAFLKRVQLQTFRSLGALFSKIIRIGVLIMIVYVNKLEKSGSGHIYSN